MISCREFADFIGAYYDGELADEQRARFDEHMSVCPSCVAYLDSYKTTVALGKAALAGDTRAKDAGIPDELVRAVMAALGKRPG